jgi:putative PIN family toxin of toxin-antitoxin system
VRVFLDTNVLASAIATRGICADVLHVTLAEHELVIGEKVLAELSRVLRTKFRVTSEDADETDAFLRREAEVVAEATRLGIRFADADDITILEQAVAGQANVFVTGDRDLLEAELKLPLRILSPRGFWDLMRETARDD